MKKILFIAAIALCAVGCCKQADKGSCAKEACPQECVKDCPKADSCAAKAACATPCAKADSCCAAAAAAAPAEVVE